jgi:hypothetical protein
MCSFFCMWHCVSWQLTHPITKEYLGLEMSATSYLATRQYIPEERIINLQCDEILMIILKKALSYTHEA